MDSRNMGNAAWEDLDMFDTNSTNGFDTPSGFDAFNDFTNLDAQYGESPIALTLRTPSKSGPDGTTGAGAQHTNGGAEIAAASASAESSSQDSSSDTSSRRKRKTGLSESPTSMDGQAHHFVKQEDSKMDMQQVRSYDHFSQPMHNLSLEQSKTYGEGNMRQQQYFNSAASSPVHTNDFNAAMSIDAHVASNMSAQYSRESPVQTINPGMFAVGGSRDPSPATNLMFNQASPNAIFSTPSSDSPEAFAANLNWNPSLAQNPQWPGDFTGQLTSPGGIAFTPSPGANGSTPASNARGLGGRTGLGRSPLHIAPISTKSRVETQINVVMTLEKPPPGVEHLHLPLHTIAKSKLLAKEDFEKSKVLELNTMLVCTSAMHNAQHKERALKRAATQDNAEIQKRAELSRDSGDEEKNDQKDLPEEDKVANGGEVKICSNCIQRERKRAGRKKTKREEEQQHWERFETERVVVFNSNEYLPFKPCEPGQYPQRDINAEGEQYVPPEGSLHVTAAMRIACYCRHQSEKEGFRVIFTLKDQQGHVVAQQISDSILITDDHKTHPQSFSTTVAGEGYYQNTAAFMPNGLPMSQSMVDMSAHVPQFTSSRSAGNLPALAYGATFNPHSHVHQLPGSGYASGTTSATMTPTSLSRPASPTNAGQAGPNKKRKSSTFHRKVPSGLTMTPRVDTSQPPSSNMPSAVSMNTPFSPSGQFPAMNQSYMTIPNNNGPAQYYGSGPPTPSENAPFNFSQPQVDMSRIQTLNNQAYFSHPSSAVPSRASSPVLQQQSRANMAAYARQHPAIQTSTNTMGNRTVQQQPFAVQAPPGSAGHDGSIAGFPSVERITPNEGPVSGGTEVVILGHHFVNGIQVQFGDQVSSTQVLSPNSMITISPPGRVGSVHLNILAPPGIAQYPQPANRPIFRYTEYNEQMMVMALKHLSEQQFGQSESWHTLAQQSATHWLQSNVTRGGLAQQGGYRMAAASLDSEDAKRVLVEAVHLQEQSADMTSDTGTTILTIACAQGTSHVTAAAMIAKRADVDLRDRCGHSPLMHADLHWRRDILQLLAQRGADSCISGLSGSSALEIVFSMSLGHRMQLLLNTGHCRGSRLMPQRDSLQPTVKHHYAPYSKASWDFASVSTYELEAASSEWDLAPRPCFRQSTTAWTHGEAIEDALPMSRCVAVSTVHDALAAPSQQLLSTMCQSQPPSSRTKSAYREHSSCTHRDIAAPPPPRLHFATHLFRLSPRLLSASGSARTPPAYRCYDPDRPTTEQNVMLDATIAGLATEQDFDGVPETSGDDLSVVSYHSRPNMSAEALRQLETPWLWVPAFVLTTSIIMHAMIPHLQVSKRCDTAIDMSTTVAVC